MTKKRRRNVQAPGLTKNFAKKVDRALENDDEIQAENIANLLREEFVMRLDDLVHKRGVTR